MVMPPKCLLMLIWDNTTATALCRSYIGLSVVHVAFSGIAAGQPYPLKYIKTLFKHLVNAPMEFFWEFAQVFRMRHISLCNPREHCGIIGRVARAGADACRPFCKCFSCLLKVLKITTECHVKAIGVLINVSLTSNSQRI